MAMRGEKKKKDTFCGLSVGKHQRFELNHIHAGTLENLEGNVNEKKKINCRHWFQGKLVFSLEKAFFDVEYCESVAKCCFQRLKDASKTSSYNNKNIKEKRKSQGNKAADGFIGSLPQPKEMITSNLVCFIF